MRYIARYPLAAALVLAVPGIAIADPVPVTVEAAPPPYEARLAVPAWPSGGWMVQQYERFVEVRFPGTEFDLDLADVAARLAEARLVEFSHEVAPEGSVLHLVLDCDCTVSVVGDGVSRLSIDVIGTGPSAPGLATPVGAAASSGPAPATAPPPRARTASAGVAPDTALSPDAPLDPAAAKDRLLAELERAAAAGIVTLADPGDAPSVSEPDPSLQGAAAPPDPNHVPIPDAAVELDTIPLRAFVPVAGAAPAPSGDTESAPPTDPTVPVPVATTASATSLADLPTDPDVQQLVCLADSELMLEALDPADAFAQRVGALRGDLVGEFDRVSETSALELARLYLSVGLGVEARETVRNFAPDHPLAPAIFEMSAVVEGERPASPGLLGDASCTGLHALWAAAGHAFRGERERALKAEARAGRSMERLPPNLRATISTLLGHAAADLENWSAARRFLASARRVAFAADDTVSASLELLRARTDLAAGKTDEALETLSTLADRRDLIGVEAQLVLAGALVSDALATDRAPHPAQAELLDRMLGALAGSAEVFRGTVAGARAAAAEVRLTAIARDVGSAIARADVAAERGMIGEAAHAAAIHEILQPAFGDLDRRELVLLHMAGGAAAPGAHLPEARYRVIEAFARTGLPDQAALLLEEMDRPPRPLVMAVAASYYRMGETARAVEVAERFGAVTGDVTDAGARPADHAGDLSAADPSAGDPPVGVLLADAAWRARDWSAAARLYASVMETAPSTEAALRLAFASHNLAAPEIPAAARDHLAEHRPGMLPAIAGMFAGEGTPAAFERLLSDAGT